MARIATFLMALISFSAISHTHDFSKREVLVFSEISSHEFTLTNRNSFTSDFAVSVNDIKIGLVKQVLPDEAITVTLELSARPNSIEHKRVCTIMRSHVPNQTQVCSLLILKRL